MSSSNYLIISDCPTCGSKKFIKKINNAQDEDDYGNMLEEPYKSLNFDIRICKDCHTTYLGLRPKQDHINHYYEGEYHCYKSFASRGLIMNLFSKISGKLLSFSIKKELSRPVYEKHLLLDYGCGSGNWIKILNKEFNNWEFIGTEVTEQAVNLAKSNEITCHKCDENNLLEFFDENSVDIINLFHVIEHIPQPINALKIFEKILTPGGIIIGQTPNIESWDAKLFGRNWTQLHVPRHMTLYSIKTLKQHAKASGLELVKVSSTASSATNWASSFLKVFNKLRNSSRHPSNIKIYPILIILFLPLVLIQSIFSYSGNINFIIKKPKNS